MKEKIVNVVKLFLLIFMMTNGFFLTYCFLWYTLGLDITTWAMWVLYALAGLSEFGYIKLVSN